MALDVLCEYLTILVEIKFLRYVINSLCWMSFDTDLIIFIHLAEIPIMHC
jgi:hypothetical protein